MTLGEKIYNLRTKAKISQEKMASDLDVSRQAVSKWETDQSIPDLENLKMIAEYFNVTVESLIDETNDDVKIKRNDRNYIVALISKISLLVSIGVCSLYFILFVVLILCQRQFIELYYYKELQLIYFPVASFIIMILEVGFYISMSSVLLKRMHKTTERVLFEVFSITGIFMLITTSHLINFIENMSLNNNIHIDFIYSITLVNNLLETLSPIMTFNFVIYLVGASLAFASKMNNVETFNEKAITSSYRKWHSVIIFFATLSLGIVSLPLYISMFKRNQNNTKYNVLKTKKWYILGLTFNLISYLLLLLIVILI